MVRRVPIAVCLSLCMACGERERPWPETASASRDSAGVRIVENARPQWGEAEGWSIDEDPIFILHGSDGSPENRLLDPTSIDVDPRGRIIVGDGNQAGLHAVLVYDSSGRFLFQAGRRGEGPGEFGQLWWASAYRGDSIVAFDMSGDGLSIFGPDGTFVREIRMPPIQGPANAPGTYGYTAGVDAAYGDGHFLAYPFGSLDITSGPGPAWYQHLLLRLDPEGEDWDTLGTFEIAQQHWSGTRQESLWYAPVARRAVGQDELYFARGDAFEIGRYDATGRLTAVVRRAHEPRPVTEELREPFREWYVDRMSTSPEANDEILERMRAQLQDARFADYVPPISAMLLDDLGYLWVEEFRWFTSNDPFPVMGPTQWSVFDPQGVWLGNVEVPAGFILRKVTGDRALGFVADELDVMEVFVYGLRRRVNGA